MFLTSYELPFGFPFGKFYRLDGDKNFRVEIPALGTAYSDPQQSKKHAIGHRAVKANPCIDNLVEKMRSLASELPEHRSCQERALNTAAA